MMKIGSILLALSLALGAVTAFAQQDQPKAEKSKKKGQKSDKGKSKQGKRKAEQPKAQ